MRQGDFFLFFFICYFTKSKKYNTNVIFRLFDKLIRLELVEDSKTLSSSTNQLFKSKNNVNLSTSESLESMFNILFRITR